MESGVFEIEIEGKNYIFSALTIGDMGDFKNYLKGKKLKLYLDAGGADEKTVNKILSSGISDNEIEDSFKVEIKWLLKRSLSKTGEEVEDDEVDKLTSLGKLEIITNILRKITSGDPDPKNLKKEKEKPSGK